jgi:hypothetical protein
LLWRPHSALEPTQQTPLCQNLGLHCSPPKHRGRNFHICGVLQINVLH